MPHAKPERLPSVAHRWPLAESSFRSVQWGDMEVGWTTIPAPLDCTELYRLAGLPGAVCQCPHYGYVIEGVVRAVYPNTDKPAEVAAAGEVYFFPAGHVLIYEAKSTVLELNPAHALQECMDAMQRALTHDPALRPEHPAPAAL